MNYSLNGGGVTLSDVKIKRGRLKADDLSKFTVTGANHRIENNKLVLTPTDNEIVLNYPISGSPSTTFQFDIFLSILILSILCSLKLSNYLADFKTIKKASRIDITFLTVFFVILFIPMSYISSDEISKTENRTLAKMPLFTQPDGRINYAYGKEYEEYFNDRFALRDFLVNFDLNIKIINAIIQNTKAFYIKENNWFGLKSNCKPLFESKKELDNIVDYFDEINKFCMENNIKFYALLVPNKEMIYNKEIQPFIKKSSIEKNNKDIEYIKNHSKANIIYPYNELKNEANKGNYVFFKSEHHWTQYGAYIGYLTLMREIKKDYPNINLISLKNDYKEYTNKKVSADFYREFEIGQTVNLLPVLKQYSNNFLDIDYKYFDNKNKNLLSEKIQKIEYLGREYYYSKGANLRVIQTGTSMNESLDNFLPYQFKNLKYIRLNNGQKVKDGKEQVKILKYYKNSILKYKPDIVILCYTMGNLTRISKLKEEN